MRIRCAWCGKSADKAAGAVNRSRERGDRLFCSRRCSGLAHRNDFRTPAQKRADKAKYDQEYRRKNRAMLKRKKAAWFQQTYDPLKAARERKKRMHLHVEYCRQPKYKHWKREYDRRYRAKEFGPFAEAYMLTIDLNREIKGRMTNEQIQWTNQTQNKTQVRRRQTAEEPPRARPRYRDSRNRNSTALG